MRIVICAYGSWVVEEKNPPKLILAELLRPERAARVSALGVELIAIDTPVVGAELEPLLKKVLKKHEPDVILGVGLAAGRSAISMETTAINTKDYRVADNSGAKPQDEPISLRAQAPAAYRSKLDNTAIVQALNSANIPARISHHAGTHCCNQMLYLAHDLAKSGYGSGDVLCGFVHVPYLHQNIAQSDKTAEPSMALSTLADGFEIILETISRAHG